MPMHISRTCLLIDRELFTHWDQPPSKIGSPMATSDGTTALGGVPSFCGSFILYFLNNLCG